MQEELGRITKKDILTSAWWALAFFAVAGLILLLWRPWLPLKTVTVDSGNIPTETIEKQLGIKTGSYRYEVALQEAFLARKLKSKNAKVSQVEMHLSGQKLSIIVSEKINAGFVKLKGHWYQLDSNGNRQSVKEPDGRGPVYSDFQSTTRIKAVAKAVASLDKVIRQDIGEIRFAPDSNNDDKLILIMNDGNTVYASQKTLAEKMRYYTGIAQSMNQNGVVDLQVGSYSYSYGS
ncbi:cell division protein FtsQ/DivIB [Fructobacillus durionis]|uniref:Cell division protein FtsQ n=1 Tax=Fructobacillus durionis TaxID=283737 RepID=A0A1I1FD57_9LACO|nr:cell division protein FtsQ/DivIB [Fructobacillus durionis]SFB95073.1 cell division protein FtsQ [Fructobacillus durionis]